MKLHFPSQLGALLLIASSAPPLLPQSSSTPVCEPATEVREALDDLPQYREDPALTDWQVYQQRLAALKTLLRKYPNDVFVHEKYIESTTSLRQVDRTSVEEKRIAAAAYKSLHEKSPDDVRIGYLYALTLTGHQNREAIKLFEDALAKDASFPLPHLPLVSIYSSDVFLNREKSKAHLKSFLDACPASFDGYRSLTSIGDGDSLSKYAAQLRPVLRNRTDADAIAAYRMLWSIEFKAQPSSEYPALRKQVGEDLENLRKLNLSDNRKWYETLEEGYKLANDQKQADWAKDQLEKRFPSAGELPEMTKWLKGHPSPDADTSPAARQTYYKNLLAQTDLWLKACDEFILCKFDVYGESLRAMSHLDDVPAADLEQAVEQRLKFAGQNGGESPWSDDYSPWSSDYSYAAEILSKKHVAPERVIDFAQKALAIWETESKEPIPDLYATKENLDNNKFYNDYSRLEMTNFEIAGYLQMQNIDKAELLLTQVDQWLQDFKLLAGDNDQRKQAYSRWLENYWGLRARDSEFRGLKLDAMAFYENALLTRLDAKVNPAEDEKDELAEDAHKLWVSMNGSETGWQLWYGHRANDLANHVNLRWEKANQPLPKFELTDLSDKTWNLGSLKGKVVFINMWASWCGPCREELPHLQKLLDHYKDRSDVQFITFNMDENPGLIQPFLKEHEVSMTVIPATSYLTESLRVNGIPQNWIVDQHGVVRRKSGGYDPSEEWVRGVENMIEEVSTTAAAPAAESR